MSTATLERTVSAAILARASDDQGGDSGSVEGQVRAGRKAAAELDWNVKVVHDVDDGFSASKHATKARVGWLALQEDIEAGRVNAVIMRTPSRGSRVMSDWIGFLDRCELRGVLIYVIQHKRVYRTDNYRDREALVNEGAKAEAFIEELSDNIKEGIETALLAGRPVGPVPYGYKRVQVRAKRSTQRERQSDENDLYVRWVPDPEAAAKVLRVFTMADDGHSLAEAARETGLSRGHVGHLVKNMAYIARRIMLDGQVIACKWEPLVPEDVFHRVAAIRAAVPQSVTMKGRPRSTYRSLLGGLAVCGKCGGKVSTHTSEQKKRGKVRTYRCAKSFCFKLDHIGDVDERVSWELVKYLLTPGVLESHLPTEDAQAAAAARGEAEALRAELAAWAADLEVSRAAYKAREASLMPMIEAAEERARTLSTPPALRAFADRIGFTSDGTATAERLNAAMRVLDDMPMEAVRNLLREVATVTIYPQAMARELGKEQVEVTFN